MSSPNIQQEQQHDNVPISSSLTPPEPSPPPVLAATTNEWIVSHELSYEIPTGSGSGGSTEQANNHHQYCFHCSKVINQLLRCSKCHIATYCNRECQINDWKNKVAGHKVSCIAYSRFKIIIDDDNDVGRGKIVQFISDTAKDNAKNDFIHRLRYYSNPYAVYKSIELGPGLLFIQSDQTLATISLQYPKDVYGKPLSRPRAVLIHYLTFAEFDMEVCHDDFELTILRTDIQQTLQTTDVQTHVVVVLRFRCGHISVGRTPLIPDYNACIKLGKEYYANNSSAGALQLNIDDV